MRYYIMRILEGSFPGSPDVDYVELTADEWRETQVRFKGRWNNII